MVNMGKYCKAYSIKKLREFKGWTEKPENARKEKQKGADGKEMEVVRTLADQDYLYLQENFVVTDGIFKDQNIIFDQVTSEWKTYCQEVLQFEIPSYAKSSAEPAGSK